VRNGSFDDVGIIGADARVGTVVDAELLPPLHFGQAMASIGRSEDREMAGTWELPGSVLIQMRSGAPAPRHPWRARAGDGATRS
jgi:hypothetical protein